MKTLKIFIPVLFIGLLLSFTNKNDCKLLQDGNYLAKVTFNRKEKDYKMNVSNGFFTKITNDGDTAKGKIIWLAGCIFKIDYPIKPEQDTSAFGKLITRSFGETCIELEGIVGDTINFRTTYTANLEVTGELGKFIHVK